VSSKSTSSQAATSQALEVYTNGYGACFSSIASNTKNTIFMVYFNEHQKNVTKQQFATVQYFNRTLLFKSVKTFPIQFAP
jgi:hypothetical protein